MFWGLLAAAAACTSFAAAPGGPPVDGDRVDAGFDGPVVVCGTNLCVGTACCIDVEAGTHRCVSTALDCQAPLVRLECDDTADCQSSTPGLVCCAPGTQDVDSGRWAMESAQCVPLQACNTHTNHDMLCKLGDRTECTEQDGGYCAPSSEYFPVFGEVSVCNMPN
jgi:hypothetical protein